MVMFWSVRGRLAAFLLTLAAASGVCEALAQEGLVQIDTLSGSLIGLRESGVASYKGIPYARPPVGPLRWRAPQPIEPWSGSRDASRFGPACPQPPFPGDPELYDLPNQSEDCLSVNVWAPENAEGLPVAVWLHGGGHRIGAGSLPFYDGSPLANRRVVVVTLNYRLGWLGYLSHPDLRAEAARFDEPSGNYGIMDQIAALRWVRDHIEAFGGDPGNVTLFGQSAGARSVLWLLSSPSAEGLFHRAVVQSGRAFAPLPRAATSRGDSDEMDAVGARLADELGAAGVVELRGLPTEALVFDYMEMQRAGFSPFIDDQVILGDPAELFVRGQMANVPLIIGVTSFEGSLVANRFGLQELRRFLGRDYRRVLAAYDLRPRDASAVETARIWQDRVYLTSARWLAQSAAEHGLPVHLYIFDHLPAFRREELPGARHGEEVPFIFDNLHLGRNAHRLDAIDLGLAKRLADTWAGFFADGVPEGVFRGEPWPPTKPGCDRWLLIRGEGSQVLEAPFANVLDVHKEAMQRSRPLANPNRELPVQCSGSVTVAETLPKERS